MPVKFDRALIPVSPDLSFEQALWEEGVEQVAGVDEAGRGAWAGPVAAAVVVLPHRERLLQDLNGVRDSKEMTPAQRTRWAGTIRAVAAGWGVGLASNAEIDALGILPATCLAVQRALEALEGASCAPQHLLLDYLRLPGSPLPQTALVKGDARSLSIAAASVLAKTARDALLVELEAVYPGYGFALHKGYGTAAHQRALEALGPCPAHRFSFAPVREGRTIREFRELGE